MFVLVESLFVINVGLGYQLFCEWPIKLIELLFVVNVSIIMYSKKEIERMFW